MFEHIVDVDAAYLRKLQDDLAAAEQKIAELEQYMDELREWRGIGPIDAVQKLVRAEAEGRVVVLPEKG